MAIPFEQQLIAILFSLSLVAVIVQLIRRHRLREEYALVWLLASIAILVLSAFGGLVRLLASLVEVSYPPTLVLVVGLLFALLILLSQSVTISGQADRVRDLAQTVALLERRLRQVEQAERPGDSPLSSAPAELAGAAGQKPS
jgi:hypothetical protein